MTVNERRQSQRTWLYKRLAVCYCFSFGYFSVSVRVTAHFVQLIFDSIFFSCLFPLSVNQISEWKIRQNIFLSYFCECLWVVHFKVIARNESNLYAIGFFVKFSKQDRNLDKKVKNKLQKKCKNGELKFIEM